MKLWSVLAVCFVLTFLVGDAQARVFRRRVTTNTSVSVNVYSSPDHAANDKATKMATQCRMAHLGGGYGGGNAEGVGCGTSEAAALNNCCFTGVRRLAAAAVAVGRNGMYYACKIFW